VPLTRLSVFPVEANDCVMRRAARCDELGIFDLQQRLLESDELVRLSVELSAERRQLNASCCKRAVREEKRHGDRGG
jgi:hypothetical protein